MSIVELTGAVGAGKSTIASALPGLLRPHGFVVFDRLTAIEICVRRSLVGSLTASLPLAHRRRIHLLAYRFLIRPLLSGRFILRHTRSARLALGSPGLRRLPRWHRRHVLGLLWRTAAATEFLKSRLAPNEVTVFEEGLVHRAVNLFGWDASSVEADSVNRFLDGLPATTLVVFVDAPKTLASERALSRGLPRRLREADGERTRIFLDTAAEVAGVVRDWLATSSRPSMLICNGGSIEDTLADLDAGLKVHLPEVPPVTVPTHRPSALRLPHPRLSLSHLRQRSEGDRPAPGPEDLGEMASWLGMPLIEGATTLSDSGRGAVFLARTVRGNVVFKRYKPTVTEPMISLEHSVLVHLQDKGFPAPRLIRFRTGETARFANGAWWAAFEYLGEGIHYNDFLWPPGRRAHLIRDSGTTLRSLHDSLSGFAPEGSSPEGFSDFEGDRVRDLAYYLDLVDDSPAARHAPSLHSTVSALKETLKDLDGRLTEANLGRHVIHGDFGPYNLLLIPGLPYQVMDFEMARVDWRVTDLAKALQQFALTRRGLSSQRMEWFLDGYRRASAQPVEGMTLLLTTWEYLTVRRVIASWHRFCTEEDNRALAEAQRKLSLLATIRQIPQDRVL